MRRYLLLLIAVPLACLLAMMAISWHAASNCLSERNLCKLVRYQTDKIRRAPAEIDTVFLGDSSLGYAVDTKIFSQLSGRQSLNLALTGWNFNLPGYYNLLTRLSESTQVRNIVLFMSPQDFDVSETEIDDPAFRGFVYTLGAGNLGNLAKGFSDYPLPIAKRVWQAVTDKGNLSDGWSDLLGDGPEPCRACMAHDYLPPGQRLESAETRAFGRANSRYVPALKRFSAFCQERAINCVFVAGAVYAPVAEASAEMIDEVARMFSANNILLARGQPLLISPSELGDSINHVAPEAKAEFTRRTLAILAPHLK